MDALRGLLPYGQAPHLASDVAVLVLWLVLVRAASPTLLRRSVGR